MQPLKAKGSKFSIDRIRPDEWKPVAATIAEILPNSIISHLGVSFGARFYGAIAAQEYSCAFAARDGAGRILGMIIGTLDHDRAYHEAVASQRLRLALAANLRLLAPATIRWVLKGRLERRAQTPSVANRPSAEMLVMYVAPKARCPGAALALVKAVESFMRGQGYHGIYVARAEVINKQSNRFWTGMGAAFACQDTFHGRQINEWHKDLAPEGKEP